MYAGRIVEEGPSEDVFGASLHPYTRALAGAFPLIGDPASRLAPRGLRGDPPNPAELPAGCPFAPRCEEAVAACAVDDVRLRRVGDTRAAACVHVGAADG
jgi:peptide/nickel transport system ATP-binding protein